MTDYFPKTYGNRNPYFEAMLKEGTNTSPIGAHSQGHHDWPLRCSPAWNAARWTVRNEQGRSNFKASAR